MRGQHVTPCPIEPREDEDVVAHLQIAQPGDDVRLEGARGDRDRLIVYGLLADLVVLIHLAFVVFVVAGGFLVLRWPTLVWLHVPSALYGAGIEFWGWVCPLTPLENRLRRRAGEAGYGGGFIGFGRLPISAFNCAVTSPQIYRPPLR